MTRFADWRAGPARLMLAGLALLVAFGVLLALRPMAPTTSSASDPTASDTALYRAITSRVAGGEGYYDAAVAEHRARVYPLRPFVTVRLPTLAWINAALGPDGTFRLLAFLAVSTILALGLRLRQDFSPLAWAGALLCVAAGAGLLILPIFTVWHEVWAGLLIALSLACRTEKRFAASLAFGIAAVAIRELALPYLGAMAAMALLDRRRGEALAWTIAALAFLVGLGIHANEIASRVRPDDLASPGWTRLGGWGLVLTMIRTSSLLGSAPLAVTAVVVPLALLGWAAWRDAIGSRGTLILAGFAGAFMVIGRPDNAYWGLLLAPLLFTGLAFVPAALRDLWRAGSNPVRAPRPDLSGEQGNPVSSRGALDSLPGPSGRRE